MSVALATLGSAQVVLNEAPQGGESLVRAEWLGPSQGLPQATVSAIAQTRDGYLWFGTHGGLVRFDGEQMRVFDQLRHPELSSNRITSLLGASDGSLWIGTMGSSVVRYHQGIFESIDAGTVGAVHTLLEDPDGTLWIGHEGLSRVRDGAVETVVEPAELGSGGVVALARTAPDRLWLTGTDYVAIWDGDALRRIVDHGGPSLVDAGNGGVWVGAVGQVLVLPDGRTRDYGLTSRALLWQPWAQRAAGDVWCVLTDGLYRWRAEDLAPMAFPASVELDPLASKTLPGWMESSFSPAAMFEDREGSLWIGTVRSGVCHVRVDASIQELDVGVGVYSCLPGEGGEILVTHEGGALGVVNSDGRMRDLEWASESDLGFIRFVLRDRKGRLWLGRAGGLECWDQGARVAVRPGVVRGGLLTSDGRVLIGGHDRLLLFEGEGMREVPLPESEGRGLAPRFEAADRSIWLTDGPNLARWHPAEGLRTIADDGRIHTSIRSIAESPEGTFWIATYGQGLFRLRGDLLDSIDSTGGLPSDSLGRVFAQSDGSLWVNSNRGVFAVSIGELESCLAGRSSDVHCRVLGTEEGNWSGGFRGEDGRLWFSTIRGLVAVDPERPLNRVPPSVFIDSVVADGVSLPLAETVRVAPGSRGVELGFSILSFADRTCNRARYRLLGRDEQWHPLGNRRTVYLGDLAPGVYTLELTASNNDGVWSDAAARQRLRVIPAHTQTWWFRGLTAAAALLAILALHRLRVRRIRSHNRTLASEIESRRRTELALRESEERYRAVAETATDGIIVVGGEGRVEYANRAAAALFGRVGTGPVGQSVGELLAGFPGRSGEARDVVEHLHAMTSGGEVVEMEALRPDGERLPVEVSSGDLRRSRGPGAYVCIVRDMTVRRQLLRQLADSNRLESIGRLTGGIAHDFNNILTAVVGHVDMLREDLQAGRPLPVLTEHVEQIQRGSERASSLVRDLMTFARQHAACRDVLDPNAVIRDLMPMLRRLIPENVTLELNLGEGVGPVLIDSHKLEQIVVNLALNGKDAIQGHGQLSIATYPVLLEGRHAVELVVADSGCGIRDEERSKIFDPFYTTKPVGRGTGLGLASVHGIVEEVGGSIRVESEQDEGSRFFVTFPVAAQGDVVEPMPVALGPAARTCGTILLCDDFAGARQAAARALRRGGFDVLEADRPGEAIRLAEGFDGDLWALVTDVVMPEMNGPELAWVLRRARPDLPVLFVSGYMAETSLDDARGKNSHFLEKPFGPSELLDALRRLLPAWQAECIESDPMRVPRS